jgi:RNA polymerase sigma-54 factor
MLRQSLGQKLEQKLSPQQIQLMKLLQVPTMELDQRIKQEIEENPALEEGKDEVDEYDNADSDEGEVTEAEEDFNINDYLDDDVPKYKTQTRQTGPDEDEKAVPLSQGKSFHEFLTEQLGLRKMTEDQMVIAETIIGNLDDSGYLRRELLSIMDDLAFSQNIHSTEEEVEEVLMEIQDLEPAGIGSRDLRECLLIQIKRKQDGNITLFTAKKILEDHFIEFTKKHYDKIIKKLEISEEDLSDALKEIIKLNPKPGNSLKDTVRNVQHIIPDFTINENDGKLELLLNGRNAPELKVSRSYEQMLRGYSEGAKNSKRDKEAVLFVKQKLDGAKWFIDAIRQRQQTLLLTMTAIMEYQSEFFLTGDETKMKPMILKDIAEIVHLDISTISRVANSKYVNTVHGTFLLKYFFSESLSTDSGEEVSTREVKKILQVAVENEEKRKPLTDEKLATLLKDKGYNIARRTVAKYREQLHIPVARLRKEI